jgi:hypothetical protein
MTTQLFTTENFKRYIDSLEKDGVVAFAVSDDLDGAAYAPSKKVNLYRVPSAIAGNLLTESNLSFVTNNSRLIIAIKDISMLSPQAFKSYTENVEKHI